MAELVVIDTPKPESRPEVIEALRAAMDHAMATSMDRVDIRLTISKGASYVLSSDDKKDPPI